MERAFVMSLKITVIYILVGATWIFFSDELLAYLVDDVGTVKVVSIYKGWLFVAATGLMLYLLVKRNMLLLIHSETAVKQRNRELAATEEELRRQIREQQKTEAELRASRQLYVELVDSIDGIVWEIDFSSFYFTFVSKRSETLLGYPVGDWLKTNTFWEKHIHPEDRNLARSACLSATERGENHELVYRFRGADGRYLWLRDVVTVITENGRPVKLRGVMFDITRGKEAEQALVDSEERYRMLNAELEQRVLERTAQLEEANKELESFSYSVSHDLRAPLRHIEGFSQVLLEDYQDRLDEEGRGHLLRLKKASQRMSQLIDDLLELSRVNRSELNRQTTDLSRIATLILLDLEQSQPDRTVTWQVADNVTATCDPRLLRVALENLLDNAWKYTARKDDAAIEFGSYRDKGEEVYYVRDNGAGFNMQYADKLFVPFQRLHRAEEFEGTGVGLATVKRIVARHGGRIWAESAPEAGATFYFTLSGVGK
ncbi:PAS domain-containing sensor histidine kinase [Geotalea sp. SG265]|uniref:sensor histidine kinase n=1 Tax=Geotalea sp. SG265 TaxID=2922867 RepID=UPI001FB0279A|nr:PAS domain-containing sensor histidine kinase [Geotalea sp. SG265]